MYAETESSLEAQVVAAVEVDAAKASVESEYSLEYQVKAFVAVGCW